MSSQNREDGDVSPRTDRGRAASLRRRWVRLAAFFLLTLGVFFALKTSGVLDELDAERIRAAILETGPLGLVAYVIVFVVGELVHVPGMVFVAGAILAYGRFWGCLAGLIGALCSVTASFLVVRSLGGRALTEVEKPLMKRLLSRLDAHPILTTIALRSVFWLGPPLNYALALSGIRFRDYFIGSALGLFTPVVLMAVFFEWVLKVAL